jgi:Bifunctional DNA primase/polymerase, N-terminal
MSERQDAAVRYARAGWPVFPTAPDNPGCEGGRDCACKIPRTTHGLKDAETDPHTIARWWSRNPAANVAIATGGIGPDVLDVDVAKGKPGAASLNEAIRAGLVPSPMATVRTGTGGSHLYYAGSDQGNGSLDKAGLDMRSAGGYVIAPPSRVHGRPYQLVSHGGAPASIDFGAIRAHFQPQPQRAPFVPREGQPLGHLVDYIASLPDGQGRHANDKTFWALCRALEHGDTATADEIERAAIGRGLSPRAVAATRRSAESRTIRQVALEASPKAGPEREAG